MGPGRSRCGVLWRDGGAWRSGSAWRRVVAVGVGSAARLRARDEPSARSREAQAGRQLLPLPDLGACPPSNAASRRVTPATVRSAESHAAQYARHELRRCEDDAGALCGPLYREVVETRAEEEAGSCSAGASLARSGGLEPRPPLVAVELGRLGVGEEALEDGGEAARGLQLGQVADAVEDLEAAAGDASRGRRGRGRRG